jgi:hypothetical protein
MHGIVYLYILLFPKFAQIIHKMYAPVKADVSVQAAHARKVAFAWLKLEEVQLESSVQGMLQLTPTEIPTWAQFPQTTAPTVSIIDPMPPNLLDATFKALPLLKAKAAFQLGLKDKDFEYTEGAPGHGSSALSQMKKLTLPNRVKTGIQQQMLQYLVCHRLLAQVSALVHEFR